MCEIKNFSIEINFNNLIYYSMDELGPNFFFIFRDPLGFYKNIKEKSEENKKTIVVLNEIVNTKYKKK